jgi:hypothetical protein
MFSCRTPYISQMGITSYLYIEIFQVCVLSGLSVAEPKCYNYFRNHSTCILETMIRNENPQKYFKIFKLSKSKRENKRKI